MHRSTSSTWQLLLVAWALHGAAATGTIDPTAESTGAIPQYSYSIFSADANASDTACGAYLVMRIYEPAKNFEPERPSIDVHFSDGTTDVGSDVLFKWWAYNASDPATWLGQKSLGQDQFAVYYFADLTKISSASRRVTGISARGSAQRVAYTNMKYEYELPDPRDGSCPHASLSIPSMLVSEIDVTDEDFSWNGPNPYMPGNPSVVSYYTAFSSPPAVTEAPRFSRPTRDVSSNSTELIPVYRLDKLTTQAVQPDGHSDSGCSPTYLFANLYGTESVVPSECEKQDMKFTYGMMRVLIPYTFDIQSDSETTFGDYDARYFSVGSHICNATDPLPFWSINAVTMGQFLNISAEESTGMPFYIFFAPPDDVRSLAKNQSTTAPPTYEWGGYRGLLLGTPDFAFIFRYRVPRADWPGSPENAPCYTVPYLNKPVDSLGGWTPEIYGDNFKSFQAFQSAASIGPVIANEDWPSFEHDQPTLHA